MNRPCLRSPDAAQCAVFAAWCAADPGSIGVGHGSAEQRYTLHRVRDTRGKRRQPSLAGLMKGARGTIDSGIADLASNPKHLAGFGRNDRRHR